MLFVTAFNVKSFFNLFDNCCNLRDIKQRNDSECSTERQMNLFYGKFRSIQTKYDMLFSKSGSL